mgnify:CR=1 FL=1
MSSSILQLTNSFVWCDLLLVPSWFGWLVPGDVQYTSGCQFSFGTYKHEIIIFLPSMPYSWCQCHAVLLAILHINRIFLTYLLSLAEQLYLFRSSAKFIASSILVPFRQWANFTHTVIGLVWFITCTELIWLTGPGSFAIYICWMKHIWTIGCYSSRHVSRGVPMTC